MLGSLVSGRPYVPLNKKYPTDRIIHILQKVGCNTAIVSSEFAAKYANLPEKIRNEMSAIGMDLDAEQRNTVNPTADFNSQDPVVEQKCDIATGRQNNVSHLVYILFTSGTTGEPKAIPISHENLSAYLHDARLTYKVGPGDRCSQAFDTTFDPSVHDIYFTWISGACLCPLTDEELLFPFRYLVDKEITVWYSVPSIAQRMLQFRMLKPASFPKLRYSMFAGEALPKKVATAWQAAAPASAVYNCYGPTEVTITFAKHMWQQETLLSEKENTVVPIGIVHPKHHYKIVDPGLTPVENGEAGELIVAGPQVATGYYDDETRTRESFIREGSRVWYRTGDKVREYADGILQYMGRLDKQVKLRGYRVELAEIERLLQGVDGIRDAIVLPDYDSDDMIKGLLAFVLGQDDLQVSVVYGVCREHLPEYMVPSQIVVLEAFPTGISGKVDNNKLLELRT
jgi:amino acid adenylation domain-containing protein